MKGYTKTKHANLVRHVSGFYHVRAKVKGREVRQSLRTKILLVAVARRDEVLSQHRASSPPASGQIWTLGEALDSYLAKIEAGGLKPKSKRYRRWTVDALKRTLGDVIDLSVARITASTLEGWEADSRKQFSPTGFNGMVETLRGAMTLACESGMAVVNPAMRIKRVRVPLSPPLRHERSDIAKVYENLKNKPSRRSAYAVVRLLETTGLRISEARSLLKEDIDLERNTLTVRTSKNGESRVVPLIPEAKELLSEILPTISDNGKVLPVGDPKKSLTAACKEVGVPRLTAHKFRHLFATRCIESGVDIRTVAEWLGHKDRGVTLLKRYAHLRNDHHQKMAALVK